MPDVNDTHVKFIALVYFAKAGPRLLNALLTYFGTVDRILHVDAGTLMSVSGMTSSAANRVANARKSLDKAERYYRELLDRRIQVVSRLDDDYPQQLARLNNPPSLLFYRGRLPDPAKKLVAISGTHRASAEGIELTVAVARQFARSGVQIISTVRSGIDASAHLGAHTENGHSFAVLESELDKIAGSAEQTVADDIVKTGGLITEIAPDSPQVGDSHEEANRIVTGIAQAVVVTEFNGKSTHTLDLLKSCNQIGQLAFVLIDPRHGALADHDALNRAVSFGALPMVGMDKVEHIVEALV